MSWLQVSITTGKSTAGSVENILIRSGSLSVTLKDAADEPILEPDIGTTPLWNNAVITGLFESSTEQKTLIDSIRSQLPDNCQMVTETLDDQDWTRSWMENYKSMQFGERLWVCPWHIDPPDSSAINLRLDPGLAFGTGTHPTTALCLKWLDKNITRQDKLLDYGCGSGILAIAALLLGVKSSDCVDIDEQAIIATLENARANNVISRIDTSSAKQFKNRLQNQKYDVVIANILSDPLIELAPVLQAQVKKEGDIVLSGILQEQAEQTRTTYARYFEMSDIKVEQDWVLLHGRKLN